MVVILDENQAYFSDRKEFKDVSEVVQKELLKKKRVVFIGEQSVLFAKTDNVKAFLQSERVYSDPAWIEELLGEEEKKKLLNLYVVNGKEFGNYLFQKPVCVVPIFFVLKKVAEKKLNGKKVVVGFYKTYGENSGEANLLTIEEGKAKKKITEKISKEELERRLETAKKSGRLDDYFVLFSVEEIVRVSQESGLLKREYTPLNDTLKEIFLEEEESKKLIRSIKVGSGLVLLSSLLYVAGAVGNYYLQKEESRLSVEVGKLQGVLNSVKQQKVYSYALSKSKKLPQKLPLNEEFLSKVTDGKFYFEVPRQLFTPQEEVEFLRKVKPYCKLKSHSVSKLILECRGVK